MVSGRTGPKITRRRTATTFWFGVSSGRWLRSVQSGLIHRAAGRRYPPVISTSFNTVRQLRTVLVVASFASK
jgi:hypothetical protein